MTAPIWSKSALENVSVRTGGWPRFGELSVGRVPYEAGLTRLAVRRQAEVDERLLDGVVRDPDLQDPTIGPGQPPGSAAIPRCFGARY